MMTDRPMCSQCDIHKNRDYWKENSPELLSMCDLCQGFQDALFKEISTQRAKLEAMANTTHNLSIS